MIRLVCLLLLACLGSVQATAHSASTSYLVLAASGHDVDVQWSLALRDLDDAVGLDSAGDGRLTWGEIRAQADKIDSYALPRLRTTSGGAACSPGPVTHLADDLGDGAYVVLRLRLHCVLPADQLEVAYSALFEVDPQHRGLIQVVRDGVSQAAVLSPSAPAATFGEQSGRTRAAAQFFVAGVRHLIGGADHLLFIAMLLAPAMLRRDSGLGDMARLREIVGILTAFTLAHAFALTLAVLDVVRMPATLTEPAIALTILLTALDNLKPFLPSNRFALGFGFGLVHGLGVAGGLGPLHLPAASLALALLAFNLGLEAVQIGLAVVTAPLGHVLRASPGSSRLLPMLSGAACIIATLWFGTRIEQSVARLTLQPAVAASQPTTSGEHS